MYHGTCNGVAPCVCLREGGGGRLIQSKQLDAERDELFMEHYGKREGGGR
jgi:hypothetical protein